MATNKKKTATVKAKKVTTAKKKTTTAKKKAVVAKKKAVATKAKVVKKSTVTKTSVTKKTTAKKVSAKKKVVAKSAPVKAVVKSMEKAKATKKSAVKVQLKGAGTAPAIDKPFTFDAANEKRIKNILKRYPREQSRSALIPVLKLAQDQNHGWLSNACIKATAERLDLAFMRALEVATFYTMFNLDPVGKYHVQVCTNCSCMIRGSGKIVDAVKEFTGVTDNGDTSEDDMFTITEVECLGACVDAPMMQINNHYYTKLDKEKTIEILDGLRKGDDVENATPTKPLPEMY